MGSAGNGAELPVLVAPLRLLPSALVEGPLAQAPQVLRTPLWPGRIAQAASGLSARGPGPPLDPRGALLFRVRAEVVHQGRHRKG